MGIMSPQRRSDDDELPELPAQSDEARSVRRNRYKEARAAGLSFAEAELFADSPVHVGLLRACVKGALSPAQIVDLLL